MIFMSLFLMIPPSVQQNIPILTPENQVKCSAVLISENFVLSANHCVKTDIVEKVMCGSNFTTATVIKTDPENDLAVLELALPCGQPVTTLASKNPEQGSDVFTLGCPGRECGKISKGVVTSYSVANGHLVLETDAKIWFGSSGGGLFDDQNHLIGICSSASRMARSDGSYEVIYGQYIPISSILKFLGV